MARRVHIEIRMYIDFQEEDCEGVADAELRDKAIAEARNQLRVGQNTAGYWSTQAADEVGIWAHQIAEVP